MEQGKPPVTPERLSQMMWGYAPPLIIEAAVRTRVFDVLDDGPRTAAEVAAATGASERGLRILMDALVGLELLRREGEAYALTPESAAFLVSSRPASFSGMFRHVSRQLIPSWLHLTDVVRLGQPSTAVNREEQGAEFFQEFVSDLFPMGYAAARKLGEHLELTRATEPVRVLDVAAGSGVWSIALAQQSPQVEVTAVDWAGVIPVTRRTTERFGLAERYRFVEGDLLEVEFGGGYQVATLGHILHSEGEQRSRALLRKVAAAMAPGGVIAIAEMVPNEARTGPPHALIFAVNMLVNTDVGDTFTFGEIGRWLEEAGFREPRLLEVPAPSPLILATRA